MCEMRWLQRHVPQRPLDRDTPVNAAHLPYHGQNEPRPHLQQQLAQLAQLGVFDLDMRGSTAFHISKRQVAVQKFLKQVVRPVPERFSQLENIRIYRLDRY